MVVKTQLRSSFAANKESIGSLRNMTVKPVQAKTSNTRNT